MMFLMRWGPLQALQGKHALVQRVNMLHQMSQYCTCIGQAMFF